eukprot:329120-Prymnesium_polylepis.1
MAWAASPPWDTTHAGCNGCRIAHSMRTFPQEPHPMPKCCTPSNEREAVLYIHTDAQKTSGAIGSVSSAAKGQKFQWLKMRKGGVVMGHKVHGFVLGIFPSEPWDEDAM